MDYFWFIELAISLVVVVILAYGFNKINEDNYDQKKKNLLTKSGFPNGALPRSKAAMISLCKALKRKRW